MSRTVLSSFSSITDSVVTFSFAIKTSTDMALDFHDTEFFSKGRRAPLA
jgi:hypothetical protein